MAQQHNAFTSPSVSLSTSAAATLNSVGRHMSIQEIHEMQDEEIEEEYEENSADGNGVDIEVEDDMHHEEEEEEEEEEDEEGDEDEFDQEALRDPASHGLKEISNLGRFTVSSQKQGNGVEELRSDDLKLYWQTIRFYVNYKEDESYTPTKIVFKSGTGENTLIEFASVELSTPVGWQDVPVFGCGGGLDGNTLVSYVFQMVILENHQNGKDTHLRGIKIYAQEHEERALGGDGLPAIDMEHMNLTPGFDSRGRPATVIANSWTPMAVIAMTNCETDEPKTEAELAKRKKVAQDAALDEWISDSLIRGPNSVTSLSLR
ncbi:Galactose-binding domain-like protein [Ceratocystis lukuohia]|uniref:Galactose-binding domain-like protein n=1 Tax=Ceratocystis lukuohia TaxID=2019550 RepID=A0ABR4MRP2_9PEZI